MRIRAVIAQRQPAPAANAITGQRFVECATAQAGDRGAVDRRGEVGFGVAQVLDEVGLDAALVILDVADGVFDVPPLAVDSPDDRRVVQIVATLKTENRSRQVLVSASRTRPYIHMILLHIHHMTR